MKYGVPQGSVLGPLLFLIYINDLHVAVKHSVTHHFADDTNFLYVSKSLKKIQKYINLDLRYVCNWLKANKISLNASKTEMLVFRDPRRKIDYNLKIKIDGKKVTPSKFVKYLGIYLDNYLSWHQQEQDMRSRLSRAAGMLCKIRHYVNFETLKMIYHGIFSSILIYGSLIWGQHKRIVNRLQTIQNKAIRYMNFKPRRSPAAPLFKSSGILNLKDYITQLNCLFAHDHINRNLPTPLLDDRINFVQTAGNTRNERLNQLANFRTKTVLYGTRSIKARAVQAWNEINVDLHHMKLQTLSKSICKNTVFKYLLNKYDDGNANNNGIHNRNININNNVNNNIINNNLYRHNNRNNANFHHGIYQGWRAGGRGIGSRWDIQSG